MPDAVTQTMIDIQPSPRILTVLGDIEFKEWQCVAELVDNAFDDFLDIKRAALSWPDGFLASVTVPTMATAAQEAEIIVRDTGRGMDLDTLNDAVRAGWSSNDRFTKLGLFGIGFNIATARLGRVARVVTTRPGDSEWVGIEIDLQAIAESEEFRAPVVTERGRRRATVRLRLLAHAPWPERRRSGSAGRDMHDLPPSCAHARERDPPEPVRWLWEHRVPLGRTFACRG